MSELKAYVKELKQNQLRMDEEMQEKNREIKDLVHDLNEAKTDLRASLQTATNTAS